jgi:hypothetical protein
MAVDQKETAGDQEQNGWVTAKGSCGFEYVVVISHQREYLAIVLLIYQALYRSN